MEATLDTLEAAGEIPRRWFVIVREGQGAEMGAHAYISGVKHGGGRAAADKQEVERGLLTR
jgi:hypothetical protein